MTKEPLASAPTSESRLLRDVRAVADIADFDPGIPSAAGSAPWVVVRTDPGASSGSATLPDAWLDGTTGKLVTAGSSPEQLVPSVSHDGEWHILSVLAGSPGARTGHYAWIEPRPLRTRGPRRDDIYDPFARPADVICRLDPERNVAPFQAVTVLPAGWEDHAREAVTVAGSDDPDESGDDLDRARAWVDSPNPLLATRGLALLARRGELTDARYEDLLGRVHGYPRAVLHYLALAHADADVAERRRSTVARDLAGGADERRAAALGTVTAALFAPQHPSADAPGIGVPAAHVERLRAAAPDDKYVGRAFALLTGAS